MTSPRQLPALLKALLLAALCLIALPGRPDSTPKPRPGDPVLSIPLAELGFDPPQPRFLVGGDTMFTLHFVDSSHILLTFNARGLIPRLPDTLPGDDERLVNALLIEIPSRRILARAQWHTRDRQQYLWPLSHGQFLLRIRRRLTLLDPLNNLAAANDAFHQSPFLEFDRRIGYISLSPGGDLLTIETVPPRNAAAEDAARFAAANGQPPPQTGEAYADPHRPGFTVAADPVLDPRTHILFYRLVRLARPGQSPLLTVQSSGSVAAQSLLRIPATSEGFLDIAQESPQTWLFDFQVHAGKRLELAPFDTSCAPSPYLISRSEFVALGCSGNGISLSGFNFRGEQPWIQMLPAGNIAPFILAAPDAGRLAFSRVTVPSSLFDTENLLPGDLTAQEIQVIQHHDGRTLLKVQASPIQRTGQNFDISPDGLSFTVIHAGNLEVYRLPPLTPKDMQQLKLAAADVPPPTTATIALTSSQAPKPVKGTAKSAFNVPSGTLNALPSAPVPQADSTSAAHEESGAALTPDTPRERPSLYTPDYPKPPK